MCVDRQLAGQPQIFYMASRTQQEDTEREPIVSFPMALLVATNLETVEILEQSYSLRIGAVQFWLGSNNVTVLNWQKTCYQTLWSVQ